LSLRPGFWRSSANSTNIVQCYTDRGCIGGLYPLDATDDEFPLCGIGYGGNLCGKCLVVDGVTYTRSGLYDCAICPEKVTNAIKIVGIFLTMLAGVIILLYVNLRKRTESETSVVLRIMTNYIQILATTAAFNLDWPSYLESFFGIVQSVSESTESYISFDCFLQDSKPFLSLFP